MIPTFITYLAGPAVGAVIGYITNDLALRMLFRPHQAKYVMGIHIPFTPGIIPKERGRIAQAIGQTISDNLINRDVLEATLLSDDMVGKVRKAINDFVAEQSDNQETLRQWAGHYLTEADIDALQRNTQANLTRLVSAKLHDEHVGESIAQAATAHVLEKTRNSMVGRLGAEAIVGKLAHPIEKLLAHQINDVLRSSGDQMASDMVGKSTHELMGQRMCDLMSQHSDQLGQITDSVVNAYRTIITEHLPRILEAIDVSAMVENRINAMDMMEAETIIMQVMRKELRAIVWLGALLGCIMGTITTILH